MLARRKLPLAVVTMVYNEAVLLPVWLRHYGRQVGSKHCYVLDDGSSDGSTRSIAARVTHLTRSQPDECRRATIANSFCAELLDTYHHVLFTDVDELVVADPDRAPTLKHWVAWNRKLPPVVSPFGVDLLHDHENEREIDWAKPISKQRKLIRPFSALCKPTLVSERPNWGAGFHFTQHVSKAYIGELYLFHLAFCDNRMLEDRQLRRNAVAKDKPVMDHHGIPPSALLRHVQGYVQSLPRTGSRLGAGEFFFECTKRMFAANLNNRELVQAEELWELPRRFRGAF